MRKRISTNTRNWRYVPIIIGILMIGIIIKILTENNNEVLAVGILTLFIFLLTGLYFVFDRAKSIEFDNEYLFISSKNSDEKISFKNILKNLLEYGHDGIQNTSKNLKVLRGITIMK